MTPRDDRFPDMLSSAQFDTAIEQVLRGDAVGDDVASIAAFVDDMRVMADRPPPPPSPELAAMLVGSAATHEGPASVVPSPPRTRGRLRARSTQPTSRRSHPSRVRLPVVAVSIAAKAAAFLAVATAATAGAAAGILPEPATHFVRRAIEVVTPFELPGDEVARPGHADGHVHVRGSSHGDGPGDTGTRPTGSLPVAIASDAAVAPDEDVGTDDPRSVPSPKGQASWADTDSEPVASALATEGRPTGVFTTPEQRADEASAAACRIARRARARDRPRPTGPCATRHATPRRSRLELRTRHRSGTQPRSPRPAGGEWPARAAGTVRAIVVEWADTWRRAWTEWVRGSAAERAGGGGE